MATTPSSQNTGHPFNALMGITNSSPSGARAIFSMYLTHASKFDDEDVENWKGGADDILIFTGLFSATVASLIALSYPNLQQGPNATTEYLLAQISQQLSSAITNGTSPVASPPTQSPFSPSVTMVFINSVWFLSLVLSLTCALIATLLQQWARRYRQIIQRNHPPQVRAQIREYFSQGARKFRIFLLVETLPLLLLVSVFLFFSGLVAFAFLANRTVACVAAATVGFCAFSYIALTLMPLKYHDCPYHTPFTSLIWYSAQIIPRSVFSVLYHGAKLWYDRWGSDGENIVKSFRDRSKNKAKSLTTMLENSAKRVSMDIYKTLAQTLHWLSEDRDLEEFVDGIPSLCESEALATRDNGDTQHTIRNVLAVLPGPTNFHASLPWSIIQLAERAFASKLSSDQQPRTRACLRALYYIPGAIRDLLAPYAAEKTHSSKILPLLNTTSSLEVIKELQNTHDEGVALPARCVAAVVASYMTTTSPTTTPNDITTGDDNSGKQFLGERLGEHCGDSARLQNIARFLRDIKDTLREMNEQWWTSDNATSIREARRTLFDTRHTAEYRTSHGTFGQQGDRASLALVPAAQQDLITLTLEILARDSVAGSATSPREAFRAAYEEFEKVAFTQAKEQAKEQRLGQPLAQMRVLSESDQEALAWIDMQAGDSIEVVKRALRPVMQSLGPQIDDTSMPYGHPPSVVVLPPQVVSTDCPDDVPVPARVGSTQKSSHSPIEAIPSLPYSTSSSAWPEAGESPV
ncbi:hypothetical protein EDB89DRAFT_2228551 [Lactarius sanguifluus]|nr:hypothetical protein EDB89DRAFT_2228551 [Lactarius sanguifluus]